MKETLRAADTKEKFKKAFFSLYATRKIETITIKEVADIAGYNRGTFYLYYKSIYDLLQKTEQELLDEFSKRVDYNVGVYYGTIDTLLDEKTLREMEEGFFRNGEYFKILNGENGDPRFRAKMKKIFKDIYRKHLNLDQTKRVSQLEYLLEYFVEANMSIINYWLENKEKDAPRISLEDVHNIMRFVGEHGFKKAFEEYRN